MTEQEQTLDRQEIAHLLDTAEYRIRAQIRALERYWWHEPWAAEQHIELRAKLYDLVQAQQRLADGRFGMCVRCGRRINYQSTTQNVLNRYCFKCKSKSTYKGEIDQKS